MNYRRVGGTKSNHGNDNQSLIVYCECTWLEVNALNKVDFPTFGTPTIPQALTEPYMIKIKIRSIPTKKNNKKRTTFAFMKDSAIRRSTAREASPDLPPFCAAKDRSDHIRSLYNADSNAQPVRCRPVRLMKQCEEADEERMTFNPSSPSFFSATFLGIAEWKDKKTLMLQLW